MGECNEIVSKMIYKRMMMVNMKVAMHILKKVCTGDTLFCNIILIINDTSRIRGITGDDMGIH